MEMIQLSATDDLPEVNFDGTKGFFQISKRSLPENAVLFYEPLVAYITNYLKLPQTETTVFFHFDYINTSSTKQLLKIILLFEQLNEAQKVTLNWHYDQGDSDMLQTGRRLEKLTSLKFCCKEI